MIRLMLKKLREEIPEAHVVGVTVMEIRENVGKYYFECCAHVGEGDYDEGRKCFVTADDNPTAVVDSMLLAVGKWRESLNEVKEVTTEVEDGNNP